MKEMMISILTIVLSMVLIDAVWLGLMFKRLYVPGIGHLLADSINLFPAIIFYLLFSLGLYVFVVGPGIKSDNGYLHFLLLGMLFGVVTYGTYDLTNQSTLKNWPILVTVLDMIWGSCLSGAVSVFSIYIIRHFI